MKPSESGKPSDSGKPDDHRKPTEASKPGPVDHATPAKPTPGAPTPTTPPTLAREKTPENLTGRATTDGAGEKTHAIALWSEGPTEAGTHTPVFHHEPRAHEIQVGGVVYTHSDTGSDGTWIYRNDRKN